MATSTVPTDYFAGRTSTRQRPGAAGLQAWKESPQGQARSPRTPTLGRSISSGLVGSPGSFRIEQEDVVIYELGARHFSAGFAGESKPRCILPFTPDGSRRVGDYRQFVASDTRTATLNISSAEWTAGHELYRTDLRNLDLGLVEDKLDRALRTAMIDYLQLDAKPRKAVLTLPSLLPTPLLEVVLKVLFGHYTQPPSISLFTHPIMCCVSAGLRHGLVVDIGWEETVVVAVSEYKEICQRRSIRAGKLLIRELANILQGQTHGGAGESSHTAISFNDVEDIAQRMAWCKQRKQDSDHPESGSDTRLSSGSIDTRVPFERLAEPAERALFAPGSNLNDHDDNDLPIHLLAHQTFLSLPTDVRALCVSRIIVTGGISNLPGVKRRVLQEVASLAETRGWDIVANYGSTASKRVLKERSPNVSTVVKEGLSSPDTPLQGSTWHGDRVHDDVKDPISIKVNAGIAKDKVVPVQGVVRGVETLGPWAGASLAAALRIKGVHEIERDSFLKHGLRTAVDI